MIKDYFLYPHVGRMDDIWASYYVQAKAMKATILWVRIPPSPPLPLCSNGLTSVSWFDPQIAPQRLLGFSESFGASAGAAFA